VSGFPYVPASGTRPDKLVLYTQPASRKVLICVAWVVALIPCSIFLLIADQISWFFAVIPVLLLSMLIFATVRVFRYAVLLEGTDLAERSAFSYRACDLTQSAVTFGAYPMTSYVPIGGGALMPVPSGRMMPALTAMDGRQAVRLNLQPPLAPWKLLALADAIVAGGQRQDPAAWQVATTLRQWAGTPQTWPQG
jgi:hypothetical protein